MAIFFFNFPFRKLHVFKKKNQAQRQLMNGQDSSTTSAS